VINNPARFRSPNAKFEYSVDKANALLDAAGWKRGTGGVREKDGRTLRFVFQTSINGPRQKTQQVIKQACQRAGIDLELKGVAAAVYFGADVANPDTNSKFWADLQMYTQNMGAPDPGRFMDRYVSWEFAQKANKWQGRNISRWRDEEYDRLYRAGEVELDPMRRVAHFIRMNDLSSPAATCCRSFSGRRWRGAARNLVVSLSGWSNDLTSLHSWYRDG
jgi:peptide/nickel transport system substrate-binding protein